MVTPRNKSEQSMVPPIKSWRVENQLVITFVRLTIVIYYKLIALTLLHEILVY